MDEFWKAADVQNYLKVSKTKAYHIIREVNQWVQTTKNVHTFQGRVYVPDLKAWMKRPLK